MKRISFNPRFVNVGGTDLVKGKIHTLRRNYDYWKKFEGRDLALFIWEGKAYRSRQGVFCVKRLVSVQAVRHGGRGHFFTEKERYIPMSELALNDGFNNENEFVRWFVKYPEEKMGILHFTGYRY
jgi:hypothetical protein